MSQSLIHGRPSRLSLVFAAFAALLLLAFAAPQAGATAKVTKVFGGPVNGLGGCTPDGAAAAGRKDATAREDFCVAFRAANPDGPTGNDLKSQVVDTPRGFSGDPDRTPQCTDAQFNKASPSDAACPGTSQVGEVQANITVADAILPGVPMTLDPTGAVYNLTHGPNEVARLGIDLRPVALGLLPQDNVKIIVRVTLRPAPDVGLRSLIDDMPDIAHTTFGERPLSVNEFNLLFWGKKGTRSMGNSAFAMLGSRCDIDQETKISALAYNGTPSSGASPTYRLENCAGAGAFQPSVAFGANDLRPDVTAETTVSVKFNSAGSGGKTAPAPKKTVVVLPQGLSFSGQIASGAAGLPLCTYEQYGQTRPEASQCPDATAVGTVRFDSPVLNQDLLGKAFLGPQPAPGALPDLFIEAQLGPAADAPRVKLVGQLTIDEQNRIVTTLDDLPEVPVDEFFLTFRGGDQAAVVTPPSCGTFEGGLVADAWTGAAGSVSNSLTIPDQPDCAAVQAFQPAVGFALADTQAGGSSTLTTTIARPDRTQRLGRVVADLPPGMLANLKGVPECSMAQAAAFACPAETRVGSVTAYAGVGPAPYRTGGAVYLTQRAEGAVAGLSIAVPIAFGEVNLGNLPVPARVEIRPDDLGLRVVADVPERFAGVPLNVRQLDIALDRKGFPLSPTNCGDLTRSSTFTSLGGVVATAAGTLKPTGCEKLGYEPELELAVSGATKNLGRPDLQVRITTPEGNGALRRAVVTLPKGISVDLAQVNARGCQLETFKAGGCPPAAIIGSVSGALAITDEPLGGNLYLLRIPGQTLPGLGLDFIGRFSGRIVGANRIDKSGRVISAFDTVPDLPLTRFQLDIKGGKGGPLVATTALCQNTAVIANGLFQSHSGKQVSRTYETLCGAKLVAPRPKYRVHMGGLRKGKPNLVLSLTAPKGKRVSRIDLQYPKQWSLSKARAKSRASVSISKLSLKLTKARKQELSSKRIASSKLRVRLPKRGTTKVRLTTRTGVLSVRAKSAKRTKKKVVIQATVRYTDGSSVKMPIRVRPR